MKKMIKIMLLLSIVPVLVLSCSSEATSNGSDDGDSIDYSKYTSLYTNPNNGFKMGKYEIVRAYYEDIMKENTYGISVTPSVCENIADGEKNAFRPVEHLSVYDAMVFCNLLSEKEGLTPFYTITNPVVSSGSMTNATVTVSSVKDANYGYRLPTYDEWKYVALDKETDVFAGATFGFHDNDLLGSYKNETKQYADDSNNVSIWFNPVTQSYNQAEGSLYQNICDPELSKVAWYRRNLATGDLFIGACPSTIKYTDNNLYDVNGTIYYFNGELTFSENDESGVLTGVLCWGADYPQSGKGFGTHQVGKKMANKKGLYDMTGNVSEMCVDSSMVNLDKAYGGNWREYANTMFVTSGVDNSGDYYKRGQVGFRICRESEDYN